MHNYNLPFPEKIAALLPHYTPNGDATLLYTCDGQELVVPRRLQAVLKNIARNLATDLGALKQLSRRHTKKVIFQPLPITPRLLLFPVKSRTARISGDGCTGYINYYAVQNIKTCNGKSTNILLTCDKIVPVLWSTETVQRHLQFCKLVANSHNTAIVAEESADYNTELMHVARKLVEAMHALLNLRKKKVESGEFRV